MVSGESYDTTMGMDRGGGLRGALRLSRLRSAPLAAFAGNTTHRKDSMPMSP